MSVGYPPPAGWEQLKPQKPDAEPTFQPPPQQNWAPEQKPPVPPKPMPEPGPRPEPTTEPEPKAKPEVNRNQRALGCLIELVETIVLTLVVFFVIQTFVAQPYQVKQQSMLPTFHEGDYVLVDKVSPRWDSYSRGDVVVFEPYTRPDCAGAAQETVPPDPFIKRVIGEPGDTVDLINGQVVVNGQVLQEPYIHGKQTTPETETSHWVVPADRLFVMGDNRTNSNDSRSFGPVCVGDVVGRAFVRYWPLAAFGIVQTPVYGPGATLAPSPSPSPSASP